LVHLLSANLAVRVATMPPGEDPDSLIRSQGADAFRDRITTARDYFDFQIDRETGRPEFASPRGRLAAARKLASSVSLLSDPVLRATVMNQAAMRLEISPEEFARMLTAPKPDSPASPRDHAADLQPLELDATIRLLCTVALRDEAARAWLLEEHWPEILEQEPGAELLMKILGADLRADDTPSVQAFLTTLDAAEESTVAGLLEEKPPANPLTIAHDLWRELERRRIRRRMDACQARLRQGALDNSEIVTLQKEVLDLNTHLANLSRLFSPPT
jgi:DNA primase